MKKPKAVKAGDLVKCGRCKGSGWHGRPEAQRDLYGQMQAYGAWSGHAHFADTGQPVVCKDCGGARVVAVRAE